LQQMAVITDAELFKGKPKRRTRSQKVSNAERIKSYSEIKPGDYVVHAHHGIGKYIGIEHMTQGGIEKDYLEIRFREGDKLYDLTDKIALIQMFIGSGEKDLALYILGEMSW